MLVLEVKNSLRRNNVFYVISKENVEQLKSKKPLILYYSENGGCGPSGLFFIIFEDKSVYSYSTFYQKSEKNLLIKHLNMFLNYKV